MVDVPTDSAFHSRIGEILDVPGVTKRMVADWAGVDPSLVTRWHQGAMPRDPLEVLRKIEPAVEQFLREAARGQRSEVVSWKSITADLDPGLRSVIERTGILASRYVVFMVAYPSSISGDYLDVSVVRFFDEVWADLDPTRTTYNLGDIAQTVMLDERKYKAESSDANGWNPFVAERPFESSKNFVKVKLNRVREIGNTIARLNVNLDLHEFDPAPGKITSVGQFGYRYVARCAVASEPVAGQTNEFLGAPVVIPSKRLELFVCIPKATVRGSPKALAYSNRSMLPLLMQLDDAPSEEVKALLWPLGRQFNVESGPDAPLRVVARAESLIDAMPKQLQDELGAPIDPDRAKSLSVCDVVASKSSQCFHLSLHAPDPSLTHTIVWRIGRPANDNFDN